MGPDAVPHRPGIVGPPHGGDPGAPVVAQNQTIPYDMSRLDTLKSQYAWAGFVYALDACKSRADMATDFSQMMTRGARTVITFDYCDNHGFTDDLLNAANDAGIFIIPLIWTLTFEGQTFSNTIQPRIDAITTAVINNSQQVIAVALGDEPLYDNDFGSPQGMADAINTLKGNFSNAGLDIPVSISDMAYGWQQAGDTSMVADAVDFFMINNFPYFSGNAGEGGDSSSWSNFISDMNYFQGIANGKTLMVTQTGWPSDESEFTPNSANVVASVQSEQDYWNLLDGHCGDYFKTNNIAWMWRYGRIQTMKHANPSDHGTIK